MTNTSYRGPRFKDRPAILAALRNEKMARSAHAYVRGNTVKFYEWLATAKGKTLPEGPPIWICGDCHVGNLGPVGDTKGRVNIQIRDLDQTVIGNPAHDLIRLGLSLAMAARGCDLPGATTALMIENMLVGYGAALADGSRHQPKPNRNVKSVHRLMEQALHRRWKNLAEERIHDARPFIPRGDKFWNLTNSEHRELKALFKSEDVRHLVTALHGRDDNAPIKILDAAYWIKGCSSLGRLRYAVLVGVGAGETEHDDICFMDIKEAAMAVAPRYPGAKMPRLNAERVVAGACHLSPNLGERMLAARMCDRSVVMRELLPEDLKLEIGRLTLDEAVNAARFLARIVGEAHAAQMDRVTRRKAHKMLCGTRSKNFDAPSWLWTSVVDLVSSHEAAYLDHCRRYPSLGDH